MWFKIPKAPRFAVWWGVGKSATPGDDVAYDQTSEKRSHLGSEPVRHPPQTMATLRSPFRYSRALPASPHLLLLCPMPPLYHVDQVGMRPEG